MRTAHQKRFGSRCPSFSGYWALIPWSVATNGSLLTAIGLRSLLLPLPLVWIGYRAFENRRQLENVGKLLMLEVAVVAWVTAFQFSQVTATSLTGTMSELALGFSNVGVVRPPGTFSAPGTSWNVRARFRALRHRTARLERDV